MELDPLTSPDFTFKMNEEYFIAKQNLKNKLLIEQKKAFKEFIVSGGALARGKPLKTSTTSTSAPKFKLENTLANNDILLAPITISIEIEGGRKINGNW